MKREYVKIWRCINKATWYQDPEAFLIALTLILNACTEETISTFDHKTKVLFPGQLIMGKGELSRITGLNPATVKLKISQLEKAGFLNFETGEEFFFITLTTYNFYQETEIKKGELSYDPQPA